jgi:hypothetical protein
MTNDDRKTMLECLSQAYDEVGNLVQTGRVKLQDIAHTYATLAVAVACLRQGRRFDNPPRVRRKRERPH